MNREKIDIFKNENIEDIAEIIVFSWASFFKQKQINENATQVFINSLNYSLFSGGMGMVKCKLLSRQLFWKWKENSLGEWSELSNLENLEKSVLQSLENVKEGFLK